MRWVRNAFAIDSNSGLFTVNLKKPCPLLVIGKESDYVRSQAGLKTEGTSTTP
jgi:hypothetical protein